MTASDWLGVVIEGAAALFIGLAFVRWGAR